MSSTTTASNQQQTVALAQIHVPGNVRVLDVEHVKALAGSIALQGILVPVVVRADGERYELVAGFHRVAAAHQLGLTEVPVVLRDAGTQDADRAIENITRKQLNPHEEALAVKAMLARGLTEDGAAQALGWAKARVSARVRLLELPERAQQLVGAGSIPLSGVEQLRQIGRVSPELLDAVVEYLADGNEWAAERLVREPGWVLDAALRESNTKTFAAHLGQVGTHGLAELRLGKKTDMLLEEALALHKQLDRYSYGLPPIRFTDSDVDQARAAGVAIEFESSPPIIVDRGLYRELAKDAVKRTVEELRASTATAAAEKKRSAKREDGQPVDPVLDARRDRDRQLRALADQAHGVNLDLGAGLLTGLSSVDPADMNVARFFVFALLGADHDGSPYTQTGERVARVAAGGIRLLVEELRADVTKTLKDGSRGRLRIDYGDTRDPEAAVKWLWRFIDAAASAGELYGRALVVLAAEQHACRLVLPVSQRGQATHWAAHRDHARKALRKLAAPHLPASLKQLEKAVARAHADYEQTEAAARNQRGPQAGAEASQSATADPEIDQVADEDDGDLEDSGDWDRELGGASDGHTVHSDADPGL